MNIPENWNKKLKAREADNALRVLSLQPNGIDFLSNDYLGFATSQELKTKAQCILEQYGEKNGSAGSRLLGGNSVLAENTETYLAQFYDAEAALIYNSGYVANLGLMSCMAERSDTILYDVLSHASLRDGIRLSFAKNFAFAHNDLHDLEQKLKKATGTCFVVTESVFSMDGDTAPLFEMLALCAQYKAHLIVDEAHAVGVFDNGLAAPFAAHPNLLARVVTFGKALGIHGAAILGSKTLQSYLINFSRAFIYTTALADDSLAKIWAAHQLLAHADDKRVKLAQNIAYFRKKAKENNLNIGESHTAIQYLVIPGNENVKRMEHFLLKNGILCKGILSPTVPEGLERLRITVHFYQKEEEIDFFIEKLLLRISAK